MVDDNSMVMDEVCVLVQDYWVVENSEHFSPHLKFSWLENEL